MYGKIKNELLQAHEHFLEGFRRLVGRGSKLLFLLFGDIAAGRCLFLFGLESFDTTHGIDKFHLTGIERMTMAADINLNFILGGPDRKRVAAGTRNDGVWIPFGVDAGFHKKAIIASIYACVDGGPRLEPAFPGIRRYRRRG